MGFTSETQCLTPSGIHATGPQSQTPGKMKSWTLGSHPNVILSWHTRVPGLGPRGSSGGSGIRTTVVTAIRGCFEA